MLSREILSCCCLHVFCPAVLSPYGLSWCCLYMYVLVRTFCSCAASSSSVLSWFYVASCSTVKEGLKKLRPVSNTDEQYTLHSDTFINISKKNLRECVCSSSVPLSKLLRRKKIAFLKYTGRLGPTNTLRFLFKSLIKSIMVWYIHFHQVYLFCSCCTGFSVLPFRVVRAVFHDPTFFKNCIPHMLPPRTKVKLLIRFYVWNIANRTGKDCTTFAFGR